MSFWFLHHLVSYEVRSLKCAAVASSDFWVPIVFQCIEILWKRASFFCESPVVCQTFGALSAMLLCKRKHRTSVEGTTYFNEHIFIHIPYLSRFMNSNHAEQVEFPRTNLGGSHSMRRASCQVSRQWHPAIKEHAHVRVMPQEVEDEDGQKVKTSSSI